MILSLLTFSLVSKTAQMICKASFFAPWGVMSPFSCLPPVTSKIAIFLVQVYFNVFVYDYVYRVCVCCFEICDAVYY